jgi:hypothetical protein
MSSWRDTILNDFVPNVSKLTLVADPDSLLTEEHLALELRQRGFDLIEFHNSIEFRYAYESQYRSLWDQGRHTDLVVILRVADTELAALPYDLLQAGRTLTFNLGELFPNLSYPVLETLDRSLLDALFGAQSQSSDRLGDHATQDFILREVFGIDAERLTDDVELLRVLLRLHYGKQPLPLPLAERLIQVLNGHAGLKNWPLAALIPDADAFFAFLQERWPLFLNQLNPPDQATLRDAPQDAGLHYPGPAYLPFDHDDIKIYIDNLFLEGQLTPVEITGMDVEAGSWLWSGMATAGGDADRRRITHLFERVEHEQPTAKSRYADWIAFALQWAELTALIHTTNTHRCAPIDNDPQHNRCSSVSISDSHFNNLQESTNEVFSQWLAAHYFSLINVPPTRPAMVHHVARRLARDVETIRNHRVALIVMDGLALDQWVTVRPFVQPQDAHFIMRESATFAWIPTLTSVSRQAIFSGKPPLYFPSSIHSTHSEEKLWKQFWAGYGLSRQDVAYQRGLGDGDPSRILDALIHPGKTQVVGLVVDKVDKIMHGMQLGSAGMHNQIKQWCQEGFLAALINQLLDYGYEVWLTADHGNIQCEGQGRPSEGVMAETRGERVRVYPTPELRTQMAGSLPFAHEWPPVGLPPDYYPLVASGRDAFVNSGQTLVGHGGIAIEEVMVPLIQFAQRTRS